MNDLRIKYTKPSFTEVSQIDTDLILITMSGGGTGSLDPFSNKGATSDSDDNSGNGDGFEYNPFQ